MIKISDLGLRRAFKPGTPLADYRPRPSLWDRFLGWLVGDAFDRPEDRVDEAEVVAAVASAMTRRPPGWVQLHSQEPDPVCEQADEVIATFREDNTR